MKVCGQCKFHGEIFEKINPGIIGVGGAVVLEPIKYNLILCHRFPKSEWNGLEYWCGEFIKSDNTQESEAKKGE